MNGKSAMTEPATERADFLLSEYREAANAYFKGVDIGWTGIRFYITINAFFATVIGIFAGRQEQPIIAAVDIIRLSPVVALGLSGAFILILPHYFEHLENCRRRCEEIETECGGQLFTRLGIIKTRRLNAVPVVVLVMLSIAFLWSIVAYRLWISPAV
jgi:hypothetical protein